MSDAHLPIRIAALYQFAVFEDCKSLQGPLAALCSEQQIRGTLLLAREGINGTVAGTDAAIDATLAHIRALPGCADLDVKESRAATSPFYRMKVRIKAEIVTMGQPDIDPLTGAGHYVAPEDWNDLIDQPETIVIDTRNDYEVAIGTFTHAVNPGTMSFRDFPNWFRTHRAELSRGEAAPKIAMFCTGGIRCEKATAFLKSEGLEDVYHLKGGILKYLETVPASESRWEGECFVFDQRVSVGHGLQVGSFDICHACRLPVSAEDKASSFFEAGVSCPACFNARSEAQRAGYTERARQVNLAKARGDTHIGLAPVPIKKPE
jgi:UPF0176 protein